MWPALPGWRRPRCHGLRRVPVHRRRHRRRRHHLPGRAHRLAPGPPAQHAPASLPVTLPLTINPRRTPTLTPAKAADRLAEGRLPLGLHHQRSVDSQLGWIPPPGHPTGDACLGLRTPFGGAGRRFESGPATYVCQADRTIGRTEARQGFRTSVERRSGGRGRRAGGRISLAGRRRVREHSRRTPTNRCTPCCWSPSGRRRE